MFGLISQYPKTNVMEFEMLGNGDGGGFSLTGRGSGSYVDVPITSFNPGFDFDISQIKSTSAKGKGSESDIKSAYELFSTGQTSGRALGYAQDIQRRYTPGLLLTYGSADIRTAAANYLDSVGLPRLARVVSPTPTPVNQTVKETTPISTTPVSKSPIELLIDAFTRSFGNAVYNPPLQNQSSGFTGIDQGVPLTESSSNSGIGKFLIIGVVGVIVYFLYKRFAS